MAKWTPSAPCPGEWRSLGKSQRTSEGRGSARSLRLPSGMWTIVNTTGSQPLAGFTLPLRVAAALPSAVDISPTLTQSPL